MKIKNREELIAKQEEYRASLNSQRKQILICAGTGCVAGGSLEIYAKMKDIIEGKGLKCALVLEKDPHGDSIGLKKSGCHGFCEMGPLLRIEPMGWLYIKVSLDDCDMSGLLYYKSLLNTNTSVSLDMNADIKMQRAGNTTNRQDEITAYPIKYEDVTLFNPANGFAAFLIPAVLILIIQQTLLLGIGLSAGTAREQNRFKDLVPINRHYNGTLRIVLGKGLSYFMVYALVSVYVLCVVPRLFSLIQIAQPGVLTLFMLPYLAACIFFAMTASIAIRNRETCMLIFVFTSVPLLFLSGVSWPGAAMPDFWRYFSYIFPSTFGINGYVRINSMGATLGEVAFEYRALWIQAGIYFLTTCWVYRWQIIQSRKHVIEKYKEYKNK